MPAAAEYADDTIVSDTLGVVGDTLSSAAVSARDSLSGAASGLGSALAAMSPLGELERAASSAAAEARLLVTGVMSEEVWNEEYRKLEDGLLQAQELLAQRRDVQAQALRTAKTQVDVLGLGSAGEQGRVGDVRQLRDKELVVEAVKQNAALRRKCEELRACCARLQKALPRGELTSREEARRDDALRRFLETIVAIETSCKACARELREGQTTDVGSAVLAHNAAGRLAKGRVGGGGAHGASATGSGGSGDGRVEPPRTYGERPRETEQTSELDRRGLLELQRDMMRNQDDKLDSISGSLQRLRQISTAIGEEVQAHEEYINEIDTRSDAVRERLKSAERSSNQVGSVSDAS
eukprot:CAMPEP_0170134140 /NCGR_PEP_ID=MMETSP0033_2-20121228/1725_1 /TAXON_ID=195969 /ORGANISM="Dolichomastix tenuilepis, Strain CCMP3274" /LENGTH=352 /DNA_ID=CAMNT_0010369685 /DNA_START=80 /DNA_END=1135 /DNA_ORIENTATION=-